MAAKGRPGPRPKPAGKRKDRVIGVRFTEAEYRRFERLAAKQHIPVAAWARAQILLALDHAADKGASRAELEAKQREQDEKLAQTEVLLKETVRLYQSAVTDRSKKSGES